MRLSSLAFAVLLFTPPAWSSGASWSNAMYEACVDAFSARLDLPAAESQLVARRLCTHARIFWPFVEVRDFENFERLAPANSPAEPLVIQIVGSSAVVNTRARAALDDVLRPKTSAAFEWSEGMSFADPDSIPGPANLLIFMDGCEPELLAKPN